VIGLGAEHRLANAKPARAFALSLELAPLLQGREWAKTASHHDLSTCTWQSWPLAPVAKELRLPANFQDPHVLVVGPPCRGPLYRSAASRLELHNAPSRARPNRSENSPSAPEEVDMGFSPAIERFRSGSAHPARDVSTAVPCAGDSSALVISSSST
jgi:hypothetical protein